MGKGLSDTREFNVHEPTTHTTSLTRHGCHKAGVVHTLTVALHCLPVILPVIFDAVDIERARRCASRLSSAPDGHPLFLPARVAGVLYQRARRCLLWFWPHALDRGHVSGRFTVPRPPNLHTAAHGEQRSRRGHGSGYRLACTTSYDAVRGAVPVGLATSL